MDKMDRKILEILLKDAQTPLTKIASEIGVHPSTVSYRIKNLIKTGAIRKFSISVNWKKLGWNIEAAVLIDAEQKDLRRIAKDLCKFEEVIEVHSITGYHDLLIMVVAKDMEDFQKFMEEKLAAISGVVRSYPAMVVEDYKEE